MNNQAQVTKVIAAVRKLAQTDPQDEAVSETVDVLQAEAKLLGGEVEKPAGFKGSFGEHSVQQDQDFLKDQISKLHSAAMAPASRYQRILAITAGLHRALMATEKPQFARIRPRIAKIVEHVAGLFAEVDTVADLDKDLEAVEKAVHGLYGDQSKNSTFYFDRRGKGHHTKSEGG
jgi:hypothetical protein